MKSFRSLANKEYEEEAKNSKAREEYEKKNKKGWFSGWFGGSSKEEEVKFSNFFFQFLQTENLKLG